MNLDLKNKRTLVCGSTQGIGKAVALELASLGAHVTLMARNENSLKEVKTELKNNGSQLHSYVCVDFTYPEKLKELILQLVQRSGPIHILVNNTGGPPAGLISQAKENEFLSAFNSHLICNHILATACIEGNTGFGTICV